MKAVESIVIPEYKADNKTVEKLLKESNKLLKELLDKPVSRGGGGGGIASFRGSDGNVTQVELNDDGSVPVTLSSGKATDAYGWQATSDDGTYKYFFFEDASTNYYILRKHKANKVATYTKGTGGYAAVYQSDVLGPSGSPTFASYGNTF